MDFLFDYKEQTNTKSSRLIKLNRERNTYHQARDEMKKKKLSIHVRDKVVVKYRTSLWKYPKKKFLENIPNSEHLVDH